MQQPRPRTIFFHGGPLDGGWAVVVAETGTPAQWVYEQDGRLYVYEHAGGAAGHLPQVAYRLATSLAKEAAQ